MLKMSTAFMNKFNSMTFLSMSIKSMSLKSPIHQSLTARRFISSSSYLSHNSNSSLSSVSLVSALSRFANILVPSIPSPTSLSLLSSSSKSYISPIAPLGLGKQIANTLSDALSDVIFQLKRTFQPSLIRRKRKHGFLARTNCRHGRKIIQRRLEKGRRALCA